MWIRAHVCLEIFGLDVRTVARKLRDHQGMLTGDRIYQNFHAQLQLAAENEHFVVGSRKYRDISCYFNDIALYYCTKSYSIT